MRQNWLFQSKCVLINWKKIEKKSPVSGLLLFITLQLLIQFLQKEKKRK